MERMVRRVLWSICREQSTRLQMGVCGCAVQREEGSLVIEIYTWFFLIRLPTSSILYNFSCSFHMWHHPVKKKKSQGHIFLYHTAAAYVRYNRTLPVIPQICIWDIGVWLGCHGSYLFFSSQRLTVQCFKENSDWLCTVCRTEGKQTALFYSLIILKPLWERL